MSLNAKYDLHYFSILRVFLDTLNIDFYEEKKWQSLLAPIHCE